MCSLRDRLYLTSGYLAGFFIIAITLLIMAQIIGRLLGLIVPSIEDFSGYALAAATFFGLAYTFREGGHIRVTLAIRGLNKRNRRLQETAILLVGLVMCGYMSWSLGYMVYESYIFEEVSYGYIPVPIWIPQVPVALGMFALTAAVLDELVLTLRGKTAGYLQHEDELNLEEI